MAYRIDRIQEDGGSWNYVTGWDHLSRTHFASLDGAVAAAREYVALHIDAGDYGQSPVDAADVRIRAVIVGDDGNEESVSWIERVGGTVDVSDVAANLYRRAAEKGRRIGLRVEDDEMDEAHELVAAGLASWSNDTVRYLVV